MMEVAAPGGIGPIISWVAPRGGAEQLPPAAPAVQLIGHLHYMAGFVAENAHTLRHRPPFDIGHPFSLEPHQAGMGEIEKDRNSGGNGPAYPFVRHPGARTNPKRTLRDTLR